MKILIFSVLIILSTCSKDVVKDGSPSDEPYWTNACSKPDNRPMHCPPCVQNIPGECAKP